MPIFIHMFYKVKKHWTYMNLDKYELTKTSNAFSHCKTCVFELKPYFFFIATQKMPIQFTFSFKNGFTLVLCNKINEFLT